MNTVLNTNTSKPDISPMLKALAAAAAVVIVLAGAAVAYIWVSGGSGQPSGAITAPALALQEGDTRTLFHLVPEVSEVRFSIDELLLQQPKTVIGVTQAVAGDLLVDFETPGRTQMGTFRINARTLKTDNEFRNRAVRGPILQAETFEFIEFTPTQVIGLPETIAFGKPFNVQIVGRLTVRGMTTEVTFEASLTPVSTTELSGTAQAVVRYRDFGLSIPEAPGVANISETVTLEIDFVARSHPAS